MTHRPISDPNEILHFGRDVDLETPLKVENARLIECGERQLRMLRRMGEVGVTLLDRLEQIATPPAQPAAHDAAASAPIADLAGAYAKLTQALRRTLAMEAKLAEEMKARRLGVVELRNDERRERVKVVNDLVDGNIEYAMGKAIRRARPDAERKDVDDLLLDMFERLREAEEFEDYLARPPGETIAKLCAAFGLDPTFCIQADDETWMIRHGPETPDEPIPPRRGEAEDAHRPALGRVDAIADSS